jgi:hypothetical protein
MIKPTNAGAHSSEHRLANIQGTKLNSKIIETWLNETLSDAEHLDIPGVLLKPNHKNPISRYGIDRHEMSNSGIPND